jgi:hypothetical protein
MSSTDNSVLKGLVQGFNQPLHDVKELPKESTELQKTCFYIEKQKYSTQMSENQSATLGVRIMCINVSLHQFYTASSLTLICSIFIIQPGLF